MFVTFPIGGKPKISTTYSKGRWECVLVRREVLQVLLTFPGLAQEGKIPEVLRVKVGNLFQRGDTSEDNLDSLPHPNHQADPLQILPPLPFQLPMEHLKITGSGGRICGLVVVPPMALGNVARSSSMLSPESGCCDW